MYNYKRQNELHSENITGLIKVGVSLCQREKESVTSVCALPKVLLIPWGHQCIHELFGTLHRTDTLYSL